MAGSDHARERVERRLGELAEVRTRDRLAEIEAELTRLRGLTAAGAFVDIEIVALWRERDALVKVGK